MEYKVNSMGVGRLVPVFFTIAMTLSFKRFYRSIYKSNVQLNARFEMYIVLEKYRIVMRFV